MTNILSKFWITTISIAFATLFTITATAHAATTPLSALKSGDLLRGTVSSSVYYFGEDGMRYVFPNDKIYFTWYPDFKNVNWIDDADLAKIQIGGNVTYKPGSKLIRFANDPRTYAVDKNGTLRGIASDAVANDLYGKNWNQQIDVVSDSFFQNYIIGGMIELASQYSIAAEQKEITSINIDKSLHPPTIVHITNNGYIDPTIHVLSGRAVHFVNDDLSDHSATEWNHIWGSGTLKPGDAFTKYFITKGTWSYYSTYDEKSKVGGAIVVE